MILRSRRYRFFGFASLVMVVLALEILVEAFLTNTSINLFWAILFMMSVYVAVLLLVDCYLSVFKSPIWMDLESDRLTIKMAFRKVVCVNVSIVERVQKKARLQLWGFYDIRLVCHEEMHTIYLQSRRYDHLGEFIEELTKVNPQLVVDPAVRSAL